MNMTPKECLLTALKRETPERVPTFEWFIDAGVTEKLCGTRDTIDAVELLDIDAVNIRADYSKNWVNEQNYIDEWGAKKCLTGDALPASLSAPITALENHRQYEFPKTDIPHRFASLERAVEKFGDRRGVVFNLRDGFSDTRDLLGYENALMGMLLDPDNFRDLLERIADYNLALAEIAVRRFGIQVIATTDDVCTARGPFIMPDVYAKTIYPAFKRTIQGFRDLGVFVIKHCDGNVLPLLDFWIDAGISCLDPIDPTAKLDMKTMREKYGARIALKGNIDCTGHLCSGTPADVETEVRECLEKSGKSGLILSSSNTIHRGVKPENYRAMLDALRQYGH